MPLSQPRECFSITIRFGLFSKIPTRSFKKLCLVSTYSYDFGQGERRDMMKNHRLRINARKKIAIQN